jgi:hypothetical protein
MQGLNLTNDDRAEGGMRGFADDLGQAQVQEGLRCGRSEDPPEDDIIEELGHRSSAVSGVGSLPHQ